MLTLTLTSRYDLDRSGTINSLDELLQLTTNLVFNMEKENYLEKGSDVGTTIVSQSKNFSGEVDWTLPQYLQWFREAGGITLRKDSVGQL